MQAKISGGVVDAGLLFPKEGFIGIQLNLSFQFVQISFVKLHKG
jgi:hypothetical protein